MMHFRSGNRITCTSLRKTPVLCTSYSANFYGTDSMVRKKKVVSNCVVTYITQACTSPVTTVRHPGHDWWRPVALIPLIRRCLSVLHSLCLAASTGPVFAYALLLPVHSPDIVSLCRWWTGCWWQKREEWSRRMCKFRRKYVCRDRSRVCRHSQHSVYKSKRLNIR